MANNSTATPISKQSKGNYSTGLTHLKALHFQAMRQKHPNVPLYAIPKAKYSDKTANGLTKCIIDFINYMGGQAERINCMGRTIDRRQVKTDVLGKVRVIGSIDYIPTTMTKGTADISATIRGRSVKIEIKIGRDRMSEAQKEYQKQIEAAGGIYFIARTFEQFCIWYNERF